MGAFRDTAHLYKVIGGLFDRVKADPAAAKKLLGGGLVIKFLYRDPAGEVTVDLTGAEIAYDLGASKRKADVEISSSSDTAHAFWSGKLNVPIAMATGKVKAKGSMTKAFALLPALKPVFALYEKTLRDLGETKMLA